MNDPEQIRAGVDRFEKYGSFTTMDVLAQGDPLKYGDVLNLNYETVFVKLLLEKDRADFERNLRQQHKK